MTRPTFGCPDGHGRYGILDRRDEDGRVLCHECGRWWHHLATHLAGGHGIRAADYRHAHGLSSGTALAGSRVRDALRAASSEPDRVEHLANIRDPDRARAGMTPPRPMGSRTCRRTTSSSGRSADRPHRRPDR